MLTAALRPLFRRPPPKLSAQAPSIRLPQADAGLASTVDNRPQTPWPASRLALTNQLWGLGFIIPGGEIEILRLARPLGLSAASSLLMVGVGSGGPACAVAVNLGAWVTGMDNDPSLLAAARGLTNRLQMGKKVTIKAWDPERPVFAARSHHHCIALEPFHGAQPEPILDGLARALRPGGHLMITELTAEAPLDLADPTVRRWGILEKRNPADLLAPLSVTRMLGRVGLDVRVAEECSDRHLEHAMLGWRVMLRDLRDSKPSRQEAQQLVAEAELWLLRRRLIREGRLRMMRWHAITRLPTS